MPHFQEFYDEYREQGLSVVAVNVIPDQDHMVPQWRNKNAFTFPILVGASTDTLVKNYRLTATPLNFLLDAQGRIISRQEGYRPGLEDRIEAKIRDSLGLD